MQRNLLIMAGVVWATLIWYSFKPLLFVAKPITHIPSIGQMKIKGFDYTSWDTSKGDAIPQFKIQGDLVRLQDKPLGMMPIAILKEIAMDQSKMVLYKEGREEVSIKANQVIPLGQQKDIFDFMKSDQIQFNDEVKVIATNGNRLACDKVFWDRAGQSLQGEGNCFLNSAKENIQASVIIINKEFTQWVLPDVGLGLI